MVISHERVLYIMIMLEGGFILRGLMLEGGLEGEIISWKFAYLFYGASI